MKTFTRVLSLTLAVLMLTLALVSCGGPAKDPEDAKKALEDNGYTVYYVSNENKLKAMFGTDTGVVAYISATSEDLEEQVTIYYFESSAKAKDAYADFDKDDIAEAEEEGWIVKQSGKIIYMGTEAAIEAAK